MEKRLTAQGPKNRKSYTVTLPIEWVKKQSLDKTKKVELDIVANKVVISTHKEISSRVLINSQEYNKTIAKIIQALYRTGVNEIKLNFDNSNLVNEVLEILGKKLVGYEILEQKRDYLIIKDITKESEEDFKIIFRRIFLLILSLSEAMDINQSRSLGKNIEKLINYCQRILIKKGHIEFKKIPIQYLMLDRLEKLKDELEWLLDITLPKNKHTKYFKEIQILLKKAYEIFYKYNANTFNIYSYKAYQLKNQIKLDNKIDKETIHLHNSARILISLYSDIFELKFE